MIFDNGFRRKYSRVLVISPPRGKILWQYQADPPESFYSETRGGLARSRQEHVAGLSPDGALARPRPSQRTR